uniref:Uncharacterized protein MANES_06G115300 n=1 Tax=Rhizophora mucronata TaxID=61149 RepID=A0A2P2KSC9_RHIMU
MAGTMVFVGELFSRICRRGSTDVLLGEVTPQILGHVQTFLSSNSASTMVDAFDSDSGSLFWLKIMEAIKDPYAVERIAEELLHQLETKNATDIEAYWTLWILFNHVIRNQPSVRSANMIPLNLERTTWTICVCMCGSMDVNISSLKVCLGLAHHTKL